MPITLNGDGAISGLTATGISAVQKLPAGTVLQVVQTVYTTDTTITSGSYTDTGISAIITPTNVANKILIFVSLQFRLAGGTSSAYDTQILRGATSIINDGASTVGTGELSVNAGSSQAISGKTSLMYLDSPSTTSATTYKVQSKLVAGSSIRHQVDSAPSVITLMEIAYA
jgi:hypothetical protein